jgi:predicted RNase H-like HicB family nuclease
MATRERTAADQYLEMPYEISLVRREDEHGPAWVAQVEEIPGCEARGRTEEEALAEVRELMASWIADALANGRQVPAPRAAATHSGRLLVRMPPTLHADLARLADREKVSLNTLIVGILSGAITWRQAGERGGSPAAPSVNGDGESAAIPARTPTAVRRERLLSVALTANLVIVVIAGLLAIGLLIALLVA